jgi:hypothetical protein
MRLSIFFSSPDLYKGVVKTHARLKFYKYVKWQGKKHLPNTPIFAGFRIWIFWKKTLNFFSELQKIWLDNKKILKMRLSIFFSSLDLYKGVVKTHARLKFYKYVKWLRKKHLPNTPIFAGFWIWIFFSKKNVFFNFFFIG